MITPWYQSPQPLLVLAPMDGVADNSFRQICKKYGQPAVMFTEFVNVEGLCSGAKALLRTFDYQEVERPLVAQLFGKTPACFYQATILVCQLGFDGVDINMGCPAPKVAGHGGGAGLIKTPDLAQEIIQAVQDGVRDWANGKTVADCPDLKPRMRIWVERVQAQLPAQYQQHRAIPVSVKTRLGYEKDILETWLPKLIEKQPAVITLHGRTFKQAYTGMADWEAIGQAAQLVQSANIKFIGNGDLKSREEALTKVADYHLDGAMIGRASWGNPWVFQPEAIRQQVTVAERAKVALEHAQLFEQLNAGYEKNSFLPMRKHLAWYIKGIAGAAELRSRLVLTNNSAEVAQIFKESGLLSLD